MVVWVLLPLFALRYHSASFQCPQCMWEEQSFKGARFVRFPCLSVSAERLRDRRQVSLRMTMNWHFSSCVMIRILNMSRSCTADERMPSPSCLLSISRTMWFSFSKLVLQALSGIWVTLFMSVISGHELFITALKVQQRLADYILPSGCWAMAAGVSFQDGTAEAHGPLARAPFLFPGNGSLEEANPSVFTEFYSLHYQNQSLSSKLVTKSSQCLWRICYVAVKILLCFIGSIYVNSFHIILIIFSCSR